MRLKATRKKNLKSPISFATAALLCAALSLSGCHTDKAMEMAEANDLTADLEVSRVQTNADLTGPGADAVMDFSVRLLQQNRKDGTNTLLSPVSALLTLAMTANGAETETLSQMEQVLGMPTDELNEYLCAYMQALPSEAESRLHFADSIWIRDDDSLKIRQEFLRTAAGYYDASVYEAAFDSQTLKDINSWVSRQTDEKIPEILSEINKDAVMYLINALSFDAEWETPYTEQNCSENTFTCEDGTTMEATFMHSQEFRYLEDGSATGFLKYYSDQNYAFAALLPAEGMTLSEYTASLTGESLKNLLSQVQDTPVDIALPKFETEYSTDLRESLQNMGMTDAFSVQTADFSGIGTAEQGPLYISKILHKTRLTLDEQGTEAGAATSTEVRSGSSGNDPGEPKEVILNRPFLYLVIDSNAGLPLFLGTADTITST